MARNAPATRHLWHAGQSWVSVGPLRGKLIAEGAPYLQDVVLSGHDRREVGALILPHVDSCAKLCPDLPPGATQAQIAAHPSVRAFVQGLLDTLSRNSTGSTTRIARAIVLAEPPSIDLGEVTDKGSINQHAVLKARAGLIEQLYAEPPPPHVIKAIPGASP